MGSVSISNVWSCDHQHGSTWLNSANVFLVLLARDLGVFQWPINRFI